jgi:hypothetical protein
VRKKRIALSVATLVLGLAGALVGNSHASAADTTGEAFESILGLHNNKGLCIGVSGSYAVSKTCVYTANGNDQTWHRTYEYGTYGYYQYENDHGQCLSVYGGGTSLNERIGAGTCNGSHLDQYWVVDEVSAGSGTYVIYNFHSGYAITIYNNSLASGAELVQYPYSSSQSQQWSIQPQSP